MNHQEPYGEGVACEQATAAGLSVTPDTSSAHQMGRGRNLPMGSTSFNSAAGPKAETSPQAAEA